MNKENQIFTIRHYKEILDVVKSTKLKTNEKCVIYCNSIKTMKELEKLLLAKDYKVLSIWSLQNEKYKMNESQRRYFAYILGNCKVPNEVDILIFNNYLMSHNFKMKDERIKILIVNISNPDKIEDVKNFVNRKDLSLIYKTKKALSKLRKEIPEKYLNTPLTTEDKEELCKELNLKNVNNKLIKWRGIKQLLQDSGYVITEKKIARNGKRIMASIISTK